jgi:hypothetical protein
MYCRGHLALNEMRIVGKGAKNEKEGSEIGGLPQDFLQWRFCLDEFVVS